MSIQGQILGSQYPYFNEPSIEAQWGTSQGKTSARTAKNGGYERLREATIRYAMIGQLKNRSVGFEQVIQEHFVLKGTYICTQIEGWIEEAETSPTKQHKKTLIKLLADLKVELAQLGDPPAEALREYEYRKYDF